jgi:integrase
MTGTIRSDANHTGSIVFLKSRLIVNFIYSAIMTLYMTNKRLGRKKAHPRGKAGWNPNPYGKYPLASQVKKFMEGTVAYYPEITQKERCRKINLITRRIVELGAEDNVFEWKKQDILRWKTDGDETLSTATLRKYWRILQDFLNFYNIEIVEDMVRRKEIRLPKNLQKEITTLDEKTIWAIHRSTHRMEGWEGDIARFVTVAYPFTGLRPGELRTMLFSDVNTQDWTLKVSTPKAAELYGMKRTVGIPSLIREEFARFIEARRKYLTSIGIDERIQWLIPYKARKGYSHWPEGKWNEIKRRINSISGIRFRWKDYRSSFCQMAIDRGAELQAVSKVMGHRTTSTTETYYGRIKDMDAIREIEGVFQ